MVCERGWGGQAADSDWSVRSPHPFLERHSDVLSCRLCWSVSAGPYSSGNYNWSLSAGPYSSGKLLVLRCLAAGGRPVPQVTWWNGTSKVRSHATLTLSISLLIMEPARSDLIQLSLKEYLSSPKLCRPVPQATWEMEPAGSDLLPLSLKQYLFLPWNQQGEISYHSLFKNIFPYHGTSKVISHTNVT
jgi:hypothetical protein